MTFHHTFRTTVWTAVFLAPLAFTPRATAQRIAGGHSKTHGWAIWTYCVNADCDNPTPLPVSPEKAGAISFDLSYGDGPNRAMLLSDLSGPQYSNGKLLGRALTAEIAVIASSGTTFNYYGDLGNGFGGAKPGGQVRLYIEGVNPNLTGCGSDFDPTRPDCEAQYWWSNPIHVDLSDLASRGSQGLTLQVILSPENWSDRDGHVGNDSTPITVGGKTYYLPDLFNAVVSNPSVTGLSFGGPEWFAFGVGVAQGQASFVLNKFMAK